MTNQAIISTTLRIPQDIRKGYPSIPVMICNAPFPTHQPDRIDWITLLTENMLSDQPFPLRHEINHPAANFHRPHKPPLAAFSFSSENNIYCI